MKKLFTLTTVLFSHVFTYAQNKIPDNTQARKTELMAFMQMPEVKVFRDSTVVEVEDTIVIQSENADVPAKFNGTGKNFKKIVSRNNMGYISDEIGEDIKTNTVITFIIEKDGTVTEAKILQPVSQEVDRELLRVFRRLPKFYPANHNGKWVRCNVIVPIRIDVERIKKREKSNGKTDIIRKSDLK